MYTAKVIDKIDNGKGYWNYLQIGVFKGEEKVFEYKRNYSSLYNTFFPFKIEEQWYALFSHHYTATAVMELPSGKIVAEETPCGGGFCPVDFFVPRYRNYKIPAKTPEELKKYPEQNHHFLIKDRIERDYDDGEKDWEEHALKLDDSNKDFIWLPGITYQLSHAFVAGCHWGADDSWKVQRLDLREVAQGKLTRSEDFGYIELPSNQNLKEAISLSSGDVSKDEYFRFTINVQKFFHYNDGKCLSE